VYLTGLISLTVDLALHFESGWDHDIQLHFTNTNVIWNYYNPSKPEKRPIKNVGGDIPD
jgi:hypothetical protein